VDNSSFLPELERSPLGPGCVITEISLVCVEQGSLSSPWGDLIASLIGI